MARRKVRTKLNHGKPKGPGNTSPKSQRQEIAETRSVKRQPHEPIKITFPPKMHDEKAKFDRKQRDAERREIIRKRKS